MAINIEHGHNAVRTHGKSVILIKRTQSYSFYCEFYLHLLFSLACIIPLYMYYAINLFSFLIRSKINNLTDCCLSLHFLWILYFVVRLLQLNPGPKYFFYCHLNLNSLTNNYLKVSLLQGFNLVHKFDITCILETQY